MKSAYKTLSTQVYQLDKPIGKSFGDIEFYQQVLSSVKGKVLEPACGNGRILVPIFNAGIDIEGFDLSEDMLKTLTSYIEDHKLALNVWHDDMTTFQTNHQYEAIVLPAGSFMLLNTENLAKKALNRFYEVLHPGGKLFIDIYLSGGLQIGDTDVRTFRVDDATTINLKMVVKDYDDKENVFTSEHVYKQYTNDILRESEREVFPLKFYTLDTFKTLLSCSGFSNIITHKNYGKDVHKQPAMYTFEASKSY